MHDYTHTIHKHAIPALIIGNVLGNFVENFFSKIP